MMNIKTIVLSGLGAICLLYLFVLVIHHEVQKGKSSCGKDSCVRFCSRSSFKLDLSLPQFEKLNKNFGSVVNSLCEETYTIDDEEGPLRFELSKEGYAYYYMNDSDIPEILKWHEYCLEVISDTNFSLMGCFIDSPSVIVQRHHPYFMISSVPFLIITIILYAWLPELRNLPGKCLMCYIISITLLFIFYAAYLINVDEIQDNSALCAFFGYLTYLLFLMSFMWLNVLCYDVYSTVRKVYTSSEKMVFLKYCAYGFLAPMVITLIVFILNHHKALPNHLQHKLGEDGVCIIGSHEKARIFYMAIPLAIMISANIIFFSITAFTIWTIQKQTASVTSTARMHQNKQRFFLYLRLFIIMGVSWMGEVISFFVAPNIFLSALSIVNCFQGVLIFFHFIWKTRILKLVAKKLNINYEIRSETTVMSTEGVSRKSVAAEVPLRTLSCP